MNQQNYQLWLQDRQKEILLEYIKDRRYKFMITMYVSLILAIVLIPLTLMDIATIKEHAESTSYISKKGDGIFLIWWLWMAGTFLVKFVQGICKVFWKNSDYDCLKHDNYTIDFVECSGKLPDSGKAPYFITDTSGNAYQWCMKFLEWKNFREGDCFLAVTLRNGQKYALLPENQL